VLVGALPVAFLVLYFGGDQVNVDCTLRGFTSAGGPLPGQADCELMIPGPIPVIGTTIGAIAASTVLIVSWFIAAATLLVTVVRRPGVLLQVVVPTILATAVAGVVGLANGADGGRGLAAGTEMAMWCAVSAAVVVFVIALGTAAVAPQRDEPRASLGDNRVAIRG
jgi:hypothetical protein